MKTLFSERYKEIIEDQGFITEFSRQLKLKLISHLNRFDEPLRHTPNRYDSFLVNLSAREETLIKYFELKDWNTDDIPQVTEEWFFNRTTHGFFDIIEIWNDTLSDGEKIPFSTEFNKIMEQFDMPWRLFDNKIIKIDSHQFEQDLMSKALLEMQEIADTMSEFRNAYQEFLEACENLTKGDNEYAILNACKSYESVLKVVLDVNRGNADVLTKGFCESIYMNNLPVDVKATGFQDKVMLALPFLRNNIAGHGDGKECYKVPQSLAKLSVNLASSLIIYVIDQFRVNTVMGHLENEDEEDTLPF